MYTIFDANYSSDLEDTGLADGKQYVFSDFLPVLINLKTRSDLRNIQSQLNSKLNTLS